MYFKYHANINIDECKTRFNNNINSPHIFVKDREVMGTLIGNFIYLYIGFKFLEKNSFKPYFWGYLSNSDNKTYIKGFFFINFGITLICLPLIMFFVFKLHSTFIEPSYESILPVIAFIVFIFWIIYSFKKEKKIIEEFIIDTISKKDESNNSLNFGEKNLRKKSNKNKHLLIFKISINLIFLLLTIVGLFVLLYFVLSILFS